MDTALRNSEMESRIRTAWAAGLFEGEGCISMRKRRWHTGISTVLLHLNMTDRDVVQRYAEWVGTTVYRRPRKDPKHKTQWAADVGKQEKVEEILKAFLPFFGERRQLKAIDALTVIRLERDVARKHRLDRRFKKQEA